MPSSPAVQCLAPPLKATLGRPRWSSKPSSGPVGVPSLPARRLRRPVGGEQTSPTNRMPPSPAPPEKPTHRLAVVQIPHPTTTTTTTNTHRIQVWLGDPI